jgi:hypothetical protein
MFLAYVVHIAHLANLNMYARKIGEKFRKHFWIAKTFPVLAKVVLSTFDFIKDKKIQKIQKS